jgi:thiosulfate dehydrogenase [quinone] large subunit
MKTSSRKMTHKSIKLFLRIAIATGFLSAVADRFGFWPTEVSAWGNWNSFIEYTAIINPMIPDALISPIGIIVTMAELLFALCLLVGFKTEYFAKLSGFLLVLFALAMTFSTGIKGVFDYSVFTASAGAFTLSLMKDKHLELDILINKKRK